MKETIIIAATVIVLAATLVAAILVGTSKSEKAECMKWSQEADAYPGYFLATWQDEQCRANGIIINVPIVK